MSKLIPISRELCERVDGMRFESPVSVTYNPLRYAREPHEDYLRRYGSAPRRILWLGMNPGPFGMGQTGVPFGDVPSVRDWLQVSGRVDVPEEWHPKRPVEGFALKRREGSGKRLWGWAEQRFGSAEAFFQTHFVHNYCPLFFVEESGRNRVPEKLPKVEREPLLEACDDALRKVVDALEAQVIVGVGKFAESRALQVFGSDGPKIVRILHPSPASPAANRGWAEAIEPVLAQVGGLP